MHNHNTLTTLQTDHRQRVLIDIFFEIFLFFLISLYISLFAFLEIFLPKHI